MSQTLDDPVPCWSPGDRARVRADAAPPGPRPVDVVFLVGPTVRTVWWTADHDEAAARGAVLEVWAGGLGGGLVALAGGLLCHAYWLEAVPAPADPLGPPCSCPVGVLVNRGCVCGRAAAERRRRG
jgi:hypothetical protein